MAKNHIADGNLQLPFVGNTADKLLQNTPIKNTLSNPLKGLPIPVGARSDHGSSNNEQAAAPQDIAGRGIKAKKLTKNTKVQPIVQQISTPSPAKPGQKYNFGPVISGVGEDDTALKASLCHKEDYSCLDNMVKAEPQTPKSLKQKQKQKQTLEQKYDKAMKEGAAQATLENAATGGAPAFGGLQLPDWNKQNHNNKTNNSKAGHSNKKGKKHKVFIILSP